MVRSKIKLLWIVFLLCNLPFCTCMADNDRYEAICQKGYKDVLQIIRVERSDTATIIEMQCVQNPGDEFCPSDAPLYLSDEKQNRYPLRRAEGITLGKKNILPYSGVLKFSLVFEPLPKDVKVFDLLSHNNKYPTFCFWGLHEKKYKLKSLPRVPEKMNFKNEFVMKEGDVKICGKIKDYVRGEKLDTLNIYQIPYRKENFLRAYSYETIINQDGTFEFDFPLENMLWVYIDGSKLHLPVMVSPDDTVNISIDRYGKYDMTVDYVSSKGYDTMSQLMKADPRAFDKEFYKKRFQTIRVPELHEEMTGMKVESHRLTEYLTWKYGLSDVESHLLLLSMNSRVDEIAIIRLNKNICRTYKHEAGPVNIKQLQLVSSMPEVLDSYSFMSDINAEDYTYFVLPCQSLMIHMNIEPITCFFGAKDRFEVLEKYMKQKLDDEWRKRIVFNN